MAIGQREADRRRTMIEVFCSEPTVKRVAGLASGWKLSADMVGIRRPLKILQVA